LMTDAEYAEMEERNAAIRHSIEFLLYWTHYCSDRVYHQSLPMVLRTHPRKFVALPVVR
jgi:hypothetical protein